MSTQVSHVPYCSVPSQKNTVNRKKWGSGSIFQSAWPTWTEQGQFFTNTRHHCSTGPLWRISTITYSWC